MVAKQYLLHTRHRYACYQYLSTCFYPPRKDVFLKDELVDHLAQSLGQVCSQAEAFSRQMGEHLLLYSTEDLSVEYAQLFVGPFELKAPPYGSVYLDGGGRTMGDSTIEVQKIYKESGLSLADDFNELPDHMAVELEFMHFLSFQEHRLIECGETENALQYLKKEYAFLANFLGSWVSPFCNRIRQNTDNKFYQLLSTIVDAFIACDLRHMESQLATDPVVNSYDAKLPAKQ